MCVAETTGSRDIVCVMECRNDIRSCFSLFKGYLVGSKSESVWFAFRKKIVSSPLPERTTAEFFDGC